MHQDFLDPVLAEFRNEPFMVFRDRPVSYGALEQRRRHYREALQDQGIGAGQVVVLEADYTPEAVALFLALVDQGAILVPLSRHLGDLNQALVPLADARWRLALGEDEALGIQRLDGAADHPHYQELRRRGHPGLVVFSSGSTGEHKGAVHDLVPILAKFHVRRHRMRTIPFLLFDHLGGLNTMWYALSNGGCLVTVSERTPDAILGAVARHRVELLPTSPTFLHLVLLSEAWKRHDLSSLKTISYGTEPMPESTLRRLHELMPDVRLLQTYGLSELGVLRSRSRESGSLWVKIGGEGFRWRVADGLLEIQAASAMLGYLNAESPFTPDGWFRTGDEVEVDGEYLKILGRRSDLINVGGQKVYPAQVESALLACPQVRDVTVRGERNPILGHMVVADVVLAGDADEKALLGQVREYCRDHLPRWQTPVKWQVHARLPYRERFKRDRRPGEQGAG